MDEKWIMVDELIHHGWKVDNDGWNSSIMMITMILTMVMFVMMLRMSFVTILLYSSLCYNLLFIMLCSIVFGSMLLIIVFHVTLGCSPCLTLLFIMLCSIACHTTLFCCLSCCDVLFIVFHFITLGLPQLRYSMKLLFLP
jgi:hypothetical protein